MARININHTLATVLGLINRDVNTIRKVLIGQESRWKKLDKADRDALVDYAKVLNAMISEEEKIKKGAKKKYDKISTDELLKTLKDSKE